MQKVMRRTAAAIFGLGFIFLGIEPLVTPPWDRIIHSWWLFPLPIPYLGNIFCCLVGLFLITYAILGPRVIGEDE